MLFYVTAQHKEGLAHATNLLRATEPPKGHRSSPGTPDEPGGLAGVLTWNEPSEKSVWVVRMNAARPET